GRVAGLARGGGDVLRPPPRREAPAGLDDELPYLGPVARHRIALCAWRCRAPESADDTGRAARSGRPRLSARARNHRRRKRRLIFFEAVLTGCGPGSM